MESEDMLKNVLHRLTLQIKHIQKTKLWLFEKKNILNISLKNLYL